MGQHRVFFEGGDPRRPVGVGRQTDLDRNLETASRIRLERACTHLAAPQLDFLWPQQLRRRLAVEQGEGCIEAAIVGHLLQPLAQYRRELSLLIERIRSTPRLPGVEAIRIPSERAFTERRLRQQTGIERVAAGEGRTGDDDGQAAEAGQYL